MIQTLKRFLLTEKTPSIQIMAYIFSGLTVATVQFTTFVIGMKLTVGQYLHASTLAFFVAILTSFTLQRYVTFAKNSKRRLHTHYSILLFVINSGFSLVLNFIIMYTGVTLLSLNSFATQLLSMVILAMYNFAAYRFIFK